MSKIPTTQPTPEFTDRQIAEYAKRDLLAAVNNTRPDQLSNLVGNFEAAALESIETDLHDVTNAIKDWYAAYLNAVGEKTALDEMNDSFEDFIFNGACGSIQERIERLQEIEAA